MSKTLQQLASGIKPEKPYPEFPLFAHASGRWAKKIRGKMHYFGRWDNPQAALDSYIEQSEFLHAGRTPKADATKTTVKDVVNAFLNHKQAQLDNDELSKHTFRDYKTACDGMIESFGKNRLADDLTPADFAALRKKWSSRWGIYALSKAIRCVHIAFNHAMANGLIDREPLYGSSFSPPTKLSFRKMKFAAGRMDFSPAQISSTIALASVSMKAMVLLGINCGFGDADCGSLTIRCINWETGIVDFPRPKTGIARRAWLWPETREALREVLANRATPANAECADLVFLTRTGKSFNRDNAGHQVSEFFRRIWDKVEPDDTRRIGFYGLRRTFRSVADETLDPTAINLIMGHEDGTTGERYRQYISNERVQRVCEHVRSWLLPSLNQGKNPSAVQSAFSELVALVSDLTASS